MKKRLLSLVLALATVLSLSVGVTAQAAEYTPQYQTEAETLYDLGLFKGTGVNSDGTPIFSLEKNATRLQAVIMLIRLLGEEEAALSTTAANPFTDIDSNSSGAKYAAYAYETGIARGYGSEFRNTTVTPSQFLTFVLRALGYDDAAGDFTVGTAIRKATKIGLIPDGMFAPGKNTLLRDECAFISYNALKTHLKDSRQRLSEKLVEDGVLTQKEVDTAGVAPVVYVPFAWNDGRYEMNAADVYAAFPEAVDVSFDTMTTNDALDKFNQADFSPLSLMLSHPAVSFYCGGIFDTLPEHEKGDYVYAVYCNRDTYQVSCVLDKDNNLIAYCLVSPEQKKDGKLAYIPCYMDASEEIAQAKALTEAAYLGASEIDASAFSVKNSRLSVDSNKLPDNAKDFKYYSCNWTSGNATTTKQAVMGVWYDAHSNPLLNTEYSPIKECDMPNAALSLGGGSAILLYDANKELVGYSVFN